MSQYPMNINGTSFDNIELNVRGSRILHVNYNACIGLKMHIIKISATFRLSWANIELKYTNFYLFTTILIKVYALP